jgi:hypothetical protein
MQVFVDETAQAVDAFIASAVFLASLSESVTAIDAIIGRYLWELIDDSQTASWQNIDDSQTPGWTTLNTAQTATWQTINNAQTSDWETIDDSQAADWTNIPTA